MITILGGELLCALGEGPERTALLRRGGINVSQRTVRVGEGEASYPYYRFDAGPRESDAEMVTGYLEKVVSAALGRVGPGPDALKRTGLFLGSSSIDYSLAWPIEQECGEAFLEHLERRRVGSGYYADCLVERFGFGGPSLTYNTACTSSANALMDAAAMLEARLIDYAVVVGLEIASLPTLEGFVMMQLLSPEAIRPFDARRNGIVLGEAVSAVVLSRDGIRDASWRYLGGTSNCETYSVTGANPNGEGIAQVMRDALRAAGVEKEAIGAIKAHGTASDLNDLSEMRGMEQVFETIPPYLSLKPYLGHTLGGCGTAELLLFMESVDAGFLPLSPTFETLDPTFSKAPLRESMAVASGRFMLNYFGFGGNNTSLVIEKVLP